MKVFISWSGEQSKRLASLFAEWLPLVIQAAHPFYSPDDINKGSKWGTELAKALEDARVGVLILTQESLSSPWVVFEAGALSRSVEHSLICPVLFGIEPKELPSPLHQFQATHFNKAEFNKLIKSINAALGDYRLPRNTLDFVFKHRWPLFHKKANLILNENPSE